MNVPSILNIEDFDPGEYLAKGSVPVCAGKVRYASGSTARAALRAIRTRGQRRDGGKKPVAEYHCATCDGYHLTSRPR